LVVAETADHMKPAHPPGGRGVERVRLRWSAEDEKEREPSVTFATLHTTLGPIRVELFDNHAPKTVRNFIGLAEGTQEYTDPRTDAKGSGPYYNGVTFHRVIEGFMAQTGDPTGTGRGGPGYTFADEIHPDLQFDRPYLLGMANTGRPVTNGGQWFITFGPTTWLNGKHTIFGTVVDDDSKRVVDAIGQAKTGPGDKPIEDIVIERVDIERQ
jgi:peptidyl-prolyl cis-trans isomerase A (cyclophilin A)